MSCVFFCVLFCVFVELDISRGNTFYSIVVLFAVIVLFEVVGVVLIVDTCCTSVIFTVSNEFFLYFQGANLKQTRKP
jgi:hypothetical protein